MLRAERVQDRRGQGYRRREERGNPAPQGRLGLSLMSFTWTSEAGLRRQRDNSGGKRKGGGEAAACQRRRGSAHSKNRLCAKNRCNLWGRSAISFTFCIGSRPPDGHPPSRPCPGPRRPFLPVSLRRKLQVLEVDAAPASRPFIHLASPRSDGARAPVSGRSSGKPQPRSATHSLTALALASGLEKRFRSPEFRKVSRRRLQRLLDKVRGQSGAARGWTEPRKS